MLHEDIFTLWPQFWNELITYLGRPSVQIQLAFFVVAIVLAWRVGRRLTHIWKNKFQPASDEDATFMPKLFYYLGLQLIPALIALALIEVAIRVMQAFDLRYTLMEMDALQGIVLVYVFIQASLALAYTIGDRDGINRYRTSLILPFTITIIAYMLLNIFVNSDRLMEAPVFAIFDNEITVAAIFLITAGFYLWLVGVNALAEGVYFLATEYGNAESGSTQATLTLIRYILIMIGIGYVLFQLNFNTTTIAAITGGLSVGAGFALSTILSNFVSGILLLFERTLHPGDIIDYNGTLGVVEMITIRSIRMRTFDNIEMIIPNSEFVTTPFTTYTGDSKHIRLKIPIGTSYDDDHRLVIETLLELAVAHPLIMDHPKPEVRIENFGDFSIDYQMYVWIASPMVAAVVKNELHHSILETFAERKITIPFPTVIEIAA